MKNDPVYVTRPFLPPLEEVLPYLEQIWASRQLTNGGRFHQELEQALCEYLGVRHISLFANGTLALVTALQALRITGEVITTPYSFVATAHSLLWNGIKPVVVDIDPTTLNLDPSKIESAITPQTTAILPNPEGSVLGGDGNGGTLVAPGSADRAALPEERQWPPTDAFGHDVADSLHTAMVSLL